MTYLDSWMADRKRMNEAGRATIPSSIAPQSPAHRHPVPTLSEAVAIGLRAITSGRGKDVPYATMREVAELTRAYQQRVEKGGDGDASVISTAGMPAVLSPSQATAQPLQQAKDLNRFWLATRAVAAKLDSLAYRVRTSEKLDAAWEGAKGSLPVRAATAVVDVAKDAGGWVLAALGLLAVIALSNRR